MAERLGDRIENTTGTVLGQVVQAGSIGSVHFHNTPGPPLAQRAFLSEPSLGRTFGPSALLRSEYKVVPFYGRDQELANLTEWCDNEDPTGIRLCTAPGGQGKTRLALEMVARLTGRGWTAGRLRPGCDEQTLRELCELPADVLLVMDYAESQPTLLGTLLELISTRPESIGRLRMLLLARSATQWWPQQQVAVADDGVQALMADAEYPLAPLFDDPADRPRLFTDAVRAFADQGDYRSAGLVPPEDLTQSRFASALALHMAALAALLDHQESGADLSAAYRDPAARVLHHEQRYWSATAHASALPHEQSRTLRNVITVASVCGAASRDEAITLLDQVPELAGEHERVLGQYADWSHQLHPGEDWLNPVAPDLLCERLVADVLADQPTMAAVFGRAAVTAAQHLQLCTTLGRAAAQHVAVRDAMPTVVASGPDTLWLTAAMVLSYLPRPDLMQAAVIGSVDGVTDPELLRSAAAHMPHSHRNCELKIAIASTALARFRAADERDVAAEAELNAALADGLTAANRFEESLEPYRTAVRLYLSLVNEKPERYKDEYLRALCNYATQLDNCDQHGAALKVCDEVVADAERYGSGNESYLLASVWWCRSQVQHNRERPGKAAKAMEKAVAACRDAAREDAYARAQLPLMIMNLANRYSDLGRHDEALTTIEESVALFRETDRLEPDPLNPSFGQALINYSQCLYACDRPSEGRAIIVEAARRLVRVTRHHTPRLPLLWSALRLWGVRLHESDFGDETVRAEYEELATLHLQPDWPRTGLRARSAALVLLDYSMKLMDDGDEDRAAEWKKKAFDLFPVEANAMMSIAQAGYRMKRRNRRIDPDF